MGELPESSTNASRPMRLCSMLWSIKSVIIVNDALYIAAIEGVSVFFLYLAATTNSVTPLESAFIPSGIAAWQDHSLRCYRVCGPVSKYLYGFPAYMSGYSVDPLYYSIDRGGMRSEWELARRFQDDYYNTYLHLFHISRILPICVTIMTGIYIWYLSRLIYGRRSAYLSLILWSWNPLVLGHGALITSDTLSALMGLCSAHMVTKLTNRVSYGDCVKIGSICAISACTKFTLLVLSLLFVAVLTKVLLDQLISRIQSPHEVAKLLFRAIFKIILITLTFFIVINTIYAWQGLWVPLSDGGALRSQVLRQTLHLFDSAYAGYASIPSPFPKVFIEGLDTQLSDTERLQRTYLLGITRLGGWPCWYFAALFFKLPIPFTLLVSISVIMHIKRFTKNVGNIRSSNVMILASCFLFLCISLSTGSGTNATVRYMLPSVALVSVAAGGLNSITSFKRSLSSVFVMFWMFVSAADGSPDQLGWSNEISQLFTTYSGVPTLVGDNLDWGQDTLRLKTWIDKNVRDECLILHIYGVGDGKVYGLSGHGICNCPLKGPNDRAPTLLAVSINFIYGYEVGRNLRCHVVDTNGLNEIISNLKNSKAAFRQIGRTIRVYRMSDLLLEKSLRQNS